MADGYDYDYLLPQGTLPRLLTEMADVWPAWVLEGEGNSLLSRDAFTGVLPPSTESGFVLHRDAGMRERFHRDGGFVDADGSAPIVVWITGWDEAMVHVDFVIDVLPPSAFLARFQDAVATAIAATASTPMDDEWVARNREQALAADPASDAGAIERASARLLGCWHRIAYHPVHDERGHRLESFTMPPGDVAANGACLVVTGRGRPMTWKPAARPAMLGS